MQRNMKQWVQTVINTPAKKAMPILSFPAVFPMGCTVEQLVRDRDLQEKAMDYVSRHTDMLAVLSMMDLSVEADAFGAEIHFAPYDLPTVVGQMISDPEEAEALTVPDVMACRTREYVEAVGRMAEKSSDKPVFAGCIGPFTLAARLQDVTEALMNCYDEPEMVHTVLKKNTAFLISYLKAFKAAGANGVILAEPLTGILSPDLADEFSHPYVKQVIAQVQDEDFLVIYHNCGDRVPALLEGIRALGAGSYHLGNAVNIKAVLPEFPEDVLVFGNIDPVGQLLNGTPETISEAVGKLLDECGTYPNFVPSTGCDVPPEAPWENIQALFQAVETWYQGHSK